MLVLQTIKFLFSAYYFVILVRVLLSWFPGRSYFYFQIRRYADFLTDPLFSLVQRAFPPSAVGIDFSPMLVVLLLWVLERIIIDLLIRLI